MAPSHVRGRHCYYNRLHLLFSFLGCAASTKAREVEKLTGAEIKEEEEPEGEMLVGPEGEALRPPGITMVSSPTHFLTFFLNVFGQQSSDSFSY